MDFNYMDGSVINKIVEQVIEELSTVRPVVPVELSARHVHLSQQDIDTLFNGPLTYANPLSQPGQFLSKERVRLIGPKGVIDNVAVLGPARVESQVEISLTDARVLGITAPVRNSGDITETPGIILASPKGIVGLEKGVIIASRHIHMGPLHAARFGLKDKDRVRVRMDSSRPVVMEDVLVRINDNSNLSMHIDVDEGNACGWEKGLPGVIEQKAARTEGGTVMQADSQGESWK